MVSTINRPPLTTPAESMPHSGMPLRNLRNLLIKLKGGLECGASGAKLVLLSFNSGRISVNSVATEEISFETRSKGRTPHPLESTRKLLIRHNLTGYRLVISPNHGTDSCFVSLPKMTRSDLDGARHLQARKVLQWEGHDPVVAYVDSGLLRDRVGSVVSLADWDIVKPWCILAEGCGAEAEEVTTHACAFQALARTQMWSLKHPVFLVCDSGASASNLYVFDSHSVRFVRRVAIGGDAVTQAITTQVSVGNDNFRLSEEDAEKFKIHGFYSPSPAEDPGIPPVQPVRRIAPPHGKEYSGDTSGVRIQRQVDMLVRPIAEKLSSEIAKSIQFYREISGQKVDAVYLAGGNSCVHTLYEQLTSTVSLPIIKVDPFAGLEFASTAIRLTAEKEKSRLAVAVGLALAEKPALSLFPRKLRIARLVARLAPRLVMLLFALGFFPLVAWGTVQKIRILHAEAQIRNSSMELQALRKSRQDLILLQAETQRLSGRHNILKQTDSQNPRWAGILNAIAEAVPDNVVLTQVGTDSSKPNATLIVLKGQALNSETGFDNAMAALLRSLSSSPFFSQVRITAAKANQTDGKTGDFEMKCELVY